MKRDLRSMRENLNAEAKQMDPQTLQNVQEAVEHYGAKSDTELLSELKGLKQAGVMDDAALGNVAQKIAPLLNPQQQQRLYEIMQQLGR